MSVNDNRSASESETPHIRGILLRTRWAARLAACVLGIWAVVFSLQFVYQVQMRSPNDPFGIDLYRDQHGAWLDLSAVLFKAVASAWMFVVTVRYLRVTRSFQSSIQPDYKALLDVVRRFWIAGGWLAIASLTYAVLRLIDIVWGLPQFSTAPERTTFSTSVPMGSSFKLEIREADYETRTGFTERSMPKVELVHTPVYLGDNIIDLKDIARATAGADDQGNPQLHLAMTESGAAKLRAATEGLVGKHVAIVIDDKILSVPRLHSSLDRKFAVSGDFTQERLNAIVDSINGRRGN